MPLETVIWYKRQEIKANPKKLYIFGDNFAETGYGGQAKEARGEHNSIGIPTKRYPTFAENAYLTDQDLIEWKAMAEPRLWQILNVLKAGGIVVWPASGIGTGLAQLSSTSPLIFLELRKWFDEFQKFEGDKIEENPPIPITRQNLPNPVKIP